MIHRDSSVEVPESETESASAEGAERSEGVRGEAERVAQGRVSSRVGPWTLVRFLGLGPLTAAFEAVRENANDPRDERYGERGVLRVLREEKAPNEALGRLFLRAAYAANRFHHGRVQGVVEDGTDGAKQPYVVRAWVDAMPLEAYAKRHRPQNGADFVAYEKDVLRIAEQVLDVLEMAHAHGVVHGAVAPSNVLVTSRGTVRLCDFAMPPGVGLGAEHAESVPEWLSHRVGPSWPAEACMTQPPSYTSYTVAHDVYAVAATVYVALTGRWPHGSASSTESAPSSGTPGRAYVPVQEVEPRVSEPCAAVLAHALQADGTQRYASAYAMLGDVRRVLAGRKPMLFAARSPHLSQSVADPWGLGKSSRRSVFSQRPDGEGMTAISQQSRRTEPSGEWKGNLVLILAMALLVGAATFVFVREKMAEAPAGLGNLGTLETMRPRVGGQGSTMSMPAPSAAP